MPNDQKEHVDWLVKEGWERSHAEEEVGLNRKKNSDDGSWQYPAGEKRGGAIIAEYIYKDEHGQNYARVQKTEHKQFPQSWWNPSVSCWVYGKHKGDKIPYRLPELLAAPPEEPVWCCEGEKDSDAAAGLGLVSTSHSEGAGKWRQVLNKWFVGKKVAYVVEDDDPPGRACANTRARNLASVVPDVRIVSFADLPGVSDLSDFITNGGTKEQLIARGQASPTFEPRPAIKVIAGQIARMVDEAQAALIAANQPVFVRAARLVEPIWTEYKTSKKGLKTRVTVLRPHCAETIIYALNKYAATFQKFNQRSQEWNDVDPPSAVAGTILHLGRWDFPLISGIVNAPTLRPDGTILSDPGYDKETQLWCEPDADLVLPFISDRPTKAEAEKALELLNDLLDGFPFVTNVHRSVALAAILTAVLRGAFSMAPLFLILAHVAGTGKSYLADLVSTIVRARPCPVMSASPNPEEMEKRLGAVILESPSIISIDNVSFDIDSDMLNQMTTQQIVKPRVLGKSLQPDCEWKGVMFITGNNIHLIGDLSRRFLTCSLDANEERPELRSFKFDPVEYVLNDRSSYIAAAIIIAKAWIADGSPVKDGVVPLVGFGDWSRMVRFPLIWLGQEDPVKSMEEARTEDPMREAIRELIDQWRQHLETDRSYRIRDIIEAAVVTQPAPQMGANMPDWEYARPEFREVLLANANAGGKKGEIDPLRVAKWLQRIRGQVHDGCRIELVQQTTHGARWMLKTAKEQK